MEIMKRVKRRIVTKETTTRETMMNLTEKIIMEGESNGEKEGRRDEKLNK